MQNYHHGAPFGLHDVTHVQSPFELSVVSHFHVDPFVQAEANQIQGLLHRTH